MTGVHPSPSPYRLRVRVQGGQCALLALYYGLKQWLLLLLRPGYLPGGIFWWVQA